MLAAIAHAAEWWYLWRVSRAERSQPIEKLSINVSNRIYLLLQAQAAALACNPSSIVETALEDFMDIVEQCDPEARAIARALSITDE